MAPPAHASTQRRRRIATRCRPASSEPPSLHPVIDPLTCIGCGSCVKACPEQPEHQVLGMINGKAHLIGPADCIGHGACRVACPVGAITLVFGTATRGVDIPRVTPWFETNVPGIFVAGELGGMGLIRNAVEQGRQAVEQIHERRPRGGKELDLVIIGAGPAGFSASLAALERRMRFVTLEQESLGGCVYPVPARQDRHDPARAPADRRRRQAGHDQQGRAARVLARHRAEGQSEDQLPGARRGDPARRTAASSCAARRASTARIASCSPSGGVERRASSAWPARSCRRSSTG